MVRHEARETGVASSLDARIARMHGRDRIGAICFVVALWVAMLFVLVAIWPFVENRAILSILVAAGVLVMTFNTAAIVAMLRHYAEDQDFIYGMDLKHLDEMRRRRG